MSLQLRGEAQLVTATATTGTATFALCTTNAFQIDNASTTVNAWVNVFLGAGTTPANFDHAKLNDPAPAVFVPFGQSRVVVGNFDVTGGGQTVIVNYITAASSATVIISPVTLNQYQSSL
jgi:hypothetical protein